MSEQIEIRLLGQFELLVGGASTRVPRSSQRLLAFLALSPRRSALRERLTRVFWPDSTRDRAYGALRTTVCRTKAIGATLLVAERDRLVLGRGVVTDLDRPWAVSPANIEQLRRLGLPRLLPAWAEDWVDNARDRRWQCTKRDASESLRSLASDGHLDQAARLSLHLLAEDPLSEPLCLLAIELNSRAGNRAIAAQIFDRYERSLWEEYGLRPSERLVSAAAAEGSYACVAS
ncbi:MAG: hypothetical protein KDB86_11260 [Actinobacteria bacterium]|nr:hypothetical protein [Actinomycetota bacterium]MCB9388182.1 hypothetical protein [Acidimicrobiia bacterium]